MADSPINVLFSREYSKLKSAVNVLPLERFTVIACPVFDITAVEQNQQLQADFTQVLSSDYLIFTSQYAVIETIAYLKTLGISSAQLKAIKTCAVGPVVARQLAEHGLTVDLLPELYTAESLADLFPVVTGKRLKIFFPKGDRAARKLEHVLSEKGYNVVAPIIYKTELRSSLDRQSQALFNAKTVDCFAFTSPSSVMALTAILDSANNRKALKNSVICAIGTTTYQACLEAGLTVSIMPNEYTIEGLARAIDSFYLTANCH